MDLIVKRKGKAAAAFGAETLGQEGAALKIERKGDVLLRGRLCRVEGRQLGAQGCLVVPVPCVIGKIPGFARSRAGSPGLLLCAPGCAQAVPAPPRSSSCSVGGVSKIGLWEWVCRRRQD